MAIYSYFQRVYVRLHFKINSMDIIKLAEQTQLIALKILEETRIIQEWESIGATVNIVGSIRSGLMMKSKDIDLHIYSDILDIEESFSIMQKLSKRLSFKEILYKNQIHTDEECIEWHAWYEDNQLNLWKFDMIHIRKGSKYDGFVERVTDAIIEKLTPEIREVILNIKFDIPETIIIPSIEIYYAVFSGKVKNYIEFEQWRRDNPMINSLDWQP